MSSSVDLSYTSQSLLWFAVVWQSSPSGNMHTETHTNTHTLETGCVQAYAQIDSAFVCSVSELACWGRSVLVVKMQTCSIWLDVTWYLHIIYIYINISVLSQGILLYATHMSRVDFKVIFWRRLKYSVWCSRAWPEVVTMRSCFFFFSFFVPFFYKIPLNSHSENLNSSPQKGLFSAL